MYWRIVSGDRLSRPLHSFLPIDCQCQLERVPVIFLLGVKQT